MVTNNSAIFNDVWDKDNNLLRTSGGTTLLTGLITFQYDDVQISYPTATTEQYAFYFEGVLKKTLEVTYADTNKEIMTRARFI